MTAVKLEDLEPQRGGPQRYDGPMVRLHNPHLKTQVYVTEAKAKSLLTNGYREGPLPEPSANQATDKG